VALAVGAALATTAVPAMAHGGWSGWCRHGEAGVERTAATCGAWIAADGRAVAPPSAPPVVRRVIQAASRIDELPYVWGGGHLAWRAKGYDCSGAVSYALHGGELLETPLVSGGLEYWGEAGGGRWINVYANAHHTFMVVAGLRFDTRDPPPGESGPRWHEWMVDGRNFTVRHPQGL
jgi:hypothetical protein